MSLVLCYHAVSPSWPAALSVEPGRFEHQLDVLLGRGYELVTFSDAVASPGTNKAAITFDDSYESVYTRAGPILEARGAVATVFVPTAYVEPGEPMSWPGIDNWVGTEHEEELMPMSWSQLGELSAAGWEIGSHTHTHPHLTELSPGRLAEELETPRSEIERNLGLPAPAIAYPYGDHDDAVLAAALAAGYTAGCTLPKRFPRPEAISWPRVGIYHGDDERRFALKVSPVTRRLRSSFVWRAVEAAGRD
jgi:peptidoglycan/xylan/chitin deacetylase (PgdA/CDA1 family)